MLSWFTLVFNTAVTEQEDFVLIFNKRKQDSVDSTITTNSEDMGQIKRSRFKHCA